MPDASLKNRREEARLPSQGDSDESASFACGHLDDTIEIIPYLESIWADRLKIAVGVLGAVVLTIVVTGLLLSRKFRAMAIIRPVPKAATASRIVGGVGGAPMGFSSI